MTVEARVVHRVAGRLRMRLPQMRGDTVWFEALGRTLAAALPDCAVAVNAATGSVLMTGRVPEPDTLRRLGQSTESFDLCRPRATGDSGQRDVSLSAADLRRLSTIVFLILAAVQVARGKVMVPAASFLWYALAGNLTLPPGPPTD